MVYLNTDLGTSPYVNSASKTSGTSITNNNKVDSASFQASLNGASNYDTSTIDPNIVAINKENPDDREADMQLYLKFKKQGVDFSKTSFADFKKNLVGFPPVSAPGNVRNTINNI